MLRNHVSSHHEHEKLFPGRETLPRGYGLQDSKMLSREHEILSRDYVAQHDQNLRF